MENTQTEKQLLETAERLLRAMGYILANISQKEKEILMAKIFIVMGIELNPGG